MNAKLFLFLLILPFLVYAGGKGYLHYEVRKGLEQIQESGEPYFEMEYGRIVSSLGGNVGVKDLRIKPHQFSEPLVFGELGIETPNVWFLLKLKDQRKLLRDGWPKSLAVYFDDIEIDLNSGSYKELLESVSQTANLSDEATTTKSAVSNHPCFDSIDDPLQVYNAIGIDKLVVDFRYGYEVLQPSENIDVQFNLDVEGVYSLDASVILKNRGSIDFVSLTSPVLVEGKISYLASGISEKLIDVCAKKLNQSKERAAETLVNHELEEIKNLGIVFDQPLIDAYQNAFFNGKTFVLTANPFEPQDLRYINQYKTEDLPDLLNLKAYAE